MIFGADRFPRVGGMPIHPSGSVEAPNGIPESYGTAYVSELVAILAIARMITNDVRSRMCPKGGRDTQLPVVVRGSRRPRRIQSSACAPTFRGWLRSKRDDPRSPVRDCEWDGPRSLRALAQPSSLKSDRTPPAHVRATGPTCVPVVGGAYSSICVRRACGVSVVATYAWPTLSFSTSMLRS